LSATGLISGEKLNQPPFGHNRIPHATMGKATTISSTAKGTEARLNTSGRASKVAIVRAVSATGDRQFN